MFIIFRKKRSYIISGLLGSSAIIGIGGILYAKYDPDFRKTLYKQVPYAEELLSDIVGPVGDDKQLPAKPKSPPVEESLMKRKMERTRSSSPLARGSASTDHLSSTIPPPSPPIDVPKSLNKQNFSETKKSTSVQQDSVAHKHESVDTKLKSSLKDDDNKRYDMPLLPGSPILDYNKRLSDLEKEFEKKVICQTNFS